MTKREPREARQPLLIDNILETRRGGDIGMPALSPLHDRRRGGYVLHRDLIPLRVTCGPEDRLQT
jgi:hypothetical protein